MKFCSVTQHAVIAGSIIILYALVFSTPKFNEKACPTLHGSSGSRRLSSDYPVSRHVDCSAVMRGDPHEIEYAGQFAWCQRDEDVPEYSYGLLTADCEQFKSAQGYHDYPVSHMEEAFPLAFSILMYESVEQLERLLQAIYRPHNVYCIHIDVKAKNYVYHGVSAVVKCFDNVFVANNLVDIHWGEFSLLEAELSCLHDLWSHSTQWKYYINLTGREFPLKTNLELVQILSAYNGANDIDGSLHRRPIVWTQYVWRSENWRTSVQKHKPPHGFLIAKGSTHVAASRPFIDFALHHPHAQDLLEWMRDIRAPDEHFFPTLNHNPHLGIPGAYSGDPDLKWFYTRLKIWWNAKNTEPCHGLWLRFICNLGVGDLPQLVSTRQMFVNKIRLEQDPVAFYCLHQWHHNRSMHNTGLNSNDIEFYRNLNFAKNHVHQLPSSSIS